MSLCLECVVPPLVITFEKAYIFNSLATVLLFPVCDQARPWFRFSTRTSSVAGLAFFLVTATRATLVICSELLFVLQIVIMSSADSGWRVFDRC